MRPLTIPRVTVKRKPNGLPNASTVCPGRKEVEFPQGALGRLVPSTLITARSVSGSAPISLACMILRSFRVTLMSTAPSMTWLLVTIYPSGEISTPLPMPCSIRDCCLPGWLKKGPNIGGMPSGSWGISPSAVSALECDVTATFTTAGVTRAASVSMAWSSDSKALTLLSSSGVAVGDAIGPRA